MIIEQLLQHNREFVANEEYRRFATTKYPDKKLAIVTCMDTSSSSCPLPSACATATSR